MNKTWKVEVHVTDNQSLNSCRRMVSDHKGITKRSDRALFMAETWCLCGPDVLVNTSVFALTWGLNLVGKQWYACPQHRQNSGTWDHQNCILIGPWSSQGLEQSVFCYFNRSMTRDRRKCASLVLYPCFRFARIYHVETQTKTGRCSFFVQHHMFSDVTNVYYGQYKLSRGH